MKEPVYEVSFTVSLPEVENDKRVAEEFPKIWEEMNDQDLYHAAEYADWFIRGINHE